MINIRDKVIKFGLWLRGKHAVHQAKRFTKIETDALAVYSHDSWGPRT